MEQFILDFLESMGNIDFGFVWQIFFYALGIFWLVVLYWVWLDSGDRTSNKTVRYMYVVLVGLLNIIGWIIYLIIRPSQTIEEIYWADLERRYLKYETAELGDCPKCGTQLYPGYTFCPNCNYRLKRRCSRCEVNIDRKNKYCPYCGQEAKSRTTPEQLSPTKEVMQQQIQATKDEATEVVETNRTRYSTRGGLAQKIGESVLGGYQIIWGKVKETVVKGKDLVKAKTVNEEKNITNNDKKNSKNFKKNKKNKSR